MKNEHNEKEGLLAIRGRGCHACKAEGETRRPLVTVTADKPSTCHPKEDNSSWEVRGPQEKQFHWTIVDKTRIKIYSVNGRQENKAYRRNFVENYQLLWAE